MCPYLQQSWGAFSLASRSGDKGWSSLPLAFSPCSFEITCFSSSSILHISTSFSFSNCLWSSSLSSSKFSIVSRSFEKSSCWIFSSLSFSSCSARSLASMSFLSNSKLFKRFNTSIRCFPSMIVLSAAKSSTFVSLDETLRPCLFLDAISPLYFFWLIENFAHCALVISWNLSGSNFQVNLINVWQVMAFSEDN